MTSERSRASQRAGRHRTGLASLAARVVESLGGRYSVELGIDVDANEDEIERWALAATLFGARISATIAERAFAILEHAGVRSIADAGRRDVGTLIELLDAGGLLARGAGVVGLRELAAAAQIDARDLEAGLVRLSLAHGRRIRDCPGGRNCTLIIPTS